MLKRLVWQKDRALLDDLVFRLEHCRNDDWELGDECFTFYKVEGLVNEYARWWMSREGFQPRNVFELGIFDGGSVVFWFEWFKPQKHVAIDIKPREDSDYFKRYVTNRHLQDRIKTYWGVNQADAKTLREIVDKNFDAPLDLVIDDASHRYDPTKSSFETLFPLLRPGGLYIFEDWAWEHLQEFQSPDHIWAKEKSPTKLIHQLVEVTGSSAYLIKSLTILPNFAVAERGSISAAQLDGFKLENYITRRPLPEND